MERYLGNCQHDIGYIIEDKHIEECLIEDHYRKLGDSEDTWYIKEVL